MDRVIVRHSDGREYDIPQASFAADRLILVDGEPMSYRDAGFAIASYADGSPYEEPVTANDRRGAKDA